MEPENKGSDPRERLEQNLSKEEILALYLNQIYYGHERYGIEEASQYYFGHTARKLTLGEAALLAGIPQSPNRLNPITDPKAAKNRQTYVLQQMAKNGYITQAVADAEIKRPIVLAPRQPPLPGPYYLEEVRKQLEQTYGADKLYEGGLSIQIAMDPKLQRYADAAVDSGLRELDKRQGYRGPLAQLGEAPTDKAGPAPKPPATDEEADSPEDEDNDTKPEETKAAAARRRRAPHRRRRCLWSRICARCSTTACRRASRASRARAWCGISRGSRRTSLRAGSRPWRAGRACACSRPACGSAAW